MDENVTMSEIESIIASLMPVAVDMIATTIETPANTIERATTMAGIVDSTSPLLALALVRVAAGLGAIAEMTGDQVRALATP